VHRLANTKPNADSDGYADSNGHADPNTNPDADPNSDANAFTDAACFSRAGDDHGNSGDCWAHGLRNGSSCIRRD
jgi:hypothetical protein